MIFVRGWRGDASHVLRRGRARQRWRTRGVGGVCGGVAWRAPLLGAWVRQISLAAFSVGADVGANGILLRRKNIFVANSDFKRQICGLKRISVDSYFFNPSDWLKNRNHSSEKTFLFSSRRVYLTPL